MLWRGTARHGTGRTPMKRAITAAAIVGLALCAATACGSSGNSAASVACTLAFYAPQGTTEILVSGPNSDEACALSNEALGFTQFSGPQDQTYPVGCTLHNNTGDTATVESSWDPQGTCDMMIAIGGAFWHR
jgi:hypothetical protein